MTTLSTVGYGDYKPLSIEEKIAGSFVMLAGVTFFSILMTNFIDIITNIKLSTFNVSEEDLHKWFVLLRRFREGKGLSKRF